MELYSYFFRLPNLSRKISLDLKPLQVMPQEGHTEIVKFLVESSADVAKLKLAACTVEAWITANIVVPDSSYDHDVICLAQTST